MKKMKRFEPIEGEHWTSAKRRQQQYTNQLLTPKKVSLWDRFIKFITGK